MNSCGCPPVQAPDALGTGLVDPEAEAPHLLRVMYIASACKYIHAHAHAQAYVYLY